MLLGVVLGLCSCATVWPLNLFSSVDCLIDLLRIGSRIWAAARAQPLLLTASVPVSYHVEKVASGND